MGPLPASDSAEPEEVDRYAALLKEMAPAVSDEEARALVSLFGPDDCFGLAWTLVHLIETSPSWPLYDALSSDNEWHLLLRESTERAGE